MAKKKAKKEAKQEPCLVVTQLAEIARRIDTALEFHGERLGEIALDEILDSTVIIMDALSDSE